MHGYSDEAKRNVEGWNEFKEWVLNKINPDNPEVIWKIKIWDYKSPEFRIWKELKKQMTEEKDSEEKWERKTHESSKKSRHKSVKRNKGKVKSKVVRYSCFLMLNMKLKNEG